MRCSITLALIALVIGRLHALERRQFARRQHAQRHVQNKCAEGEIPCLNVTCAESAECRHCIPASWQCDGQSDCPTPSDNNDENSISSDEQNCRRINCKPNHFRCGGGEKTCVPPHRVCNGRFDCRDGSDEVNCEASSRLCPPGLLPCTGGRCVPAVWRCDGKNQCSDGADEQDCTGNQCRAGLFRCDSGQCVNAHWRCDGASDCADSSDEKECGRQSQRLGTALQRCPSDQVACNSGNQCIYPSWRCNGVEDCLDGSDEHLCGVREGSCAHGWFTCSQSGVCLNRTRLCNGVNDCPESSEDEQDCTNTSLESTYNLRSSTQLDKNNACGAGQFDCNDGVSGRSSRRRCISLHLRCDGEDHCGTDELDCGSDYQCPHPLITCQSGLKRCAPSDTRCDGVKDCDDGSDEINCFALSQNRSQLATNEQNKDAGESQDCPAGTFRCGNGECISDLWMCDGDDDCGDNSDEAALMCETRSCNEPTAIASGSGGHVVRFGCDRGRCVPADWLCDGEMDCDDASDEIGCGVTALHTRSTDSVAVGNDTECFPQQFSCRQGGCVDQVWVCNGVDDCSDASDEEPAMCAERGCSLQQFQCRDGGHCLPLAWLCDGGRDCDDESDEDSCQFHGSSGSSGDEDNPSGSPLLRSVPQVQCSGNQFACANQVQCVSKLWVCDSNADCSDGSDEQNCTSHRCSDGEYRCASGHCIPNGWVCDGSADCDDSSDEKRCPSTSSSNVLVRSSSSSSSTSASGAITANSAATGHVAYTGLSPDTITDLRRRLQRAFVAAHLGERRVALRQIVDVLARLPPPPEPQFFANAPERQAPKVEESY